MKFQIKTVTGAIALSKEEFEALCFEDGYVMDGATLSSRLEDLPEVQKVGYFSARDPEPEVEITLRANDLGGVPDLSNVFEVVRGHVVACRIEASR